MRGLTSVEVERARSRHRGLVLLYITDRCPVRCAHCSVGSRPDSARIRDFDLFEEIVDGVCALGDHPIVGISGGEPFAERRGLTWAVDRLADAGKRIVLYTSGFWASGIAGHGGPGSDETTPAWARQVIRRVDCVYLSTDRYHQATVSRERFVGAARAVVAQDVWLVVQVVEEEGEDAPTRAEGLLRAAFGAGWAQYAEITAVPLLPYGRAESLDTTGALSSRFRETRRGDAFTTPCTTANVPVVRYDGTVTMCCNEAIVTGTGPARARRRCGGGREVTAAVQTFGADSLLQVTGTRGPGLATMHPRYAELAGREFDTVCALCWELVERAPDAARDPLLDAIRVLAGRRVPTGGTS